MTAIAITLIVCAALVACFWLHLQAVRLTSRMTQRTLDEADVARDALAKLQRERKEHELQLAERFNEWESRLDGLEKRELKRGMR
jgi:hypothetical protein